MPSIQQQEMLVPNDLAEARYQVALANRMLANEGVLDAFGHVSLRHPGDPGRYLLSRSRSPESDRAGRRARIHPRFHAREAALGRALRRAGDPRLHLSGEAGRDGGRSSPFAGRAAVLHCRRADRAGVSPRRGGRRDRAVLEPAEGVRRHQSARGQAGGGGIARPRARIARRRAAEQSRRDRGRDAICANSSRAAIFMCQNAEYQFRRSFSARS